MDSDEPDFVPIMSDLAPHRSKQTSKARFVEDVGDQTRNIGSKETPYHTRAKSRKRRSTHTPHRHHSRDIHDSHEGGRPRRRRRDSWGTGDYDSDEKSDESLPPHFSRSRIAATDRFSEDTDFDPKIFDHEYLLPSLTFHFDTAQVNPEEETQISTMTRSIKQSTRLDAKEYRYKSYHENIDNIVRSQYVGGIHGREDSTAELITNNAQESSNRRQPALLKWIQIERQYPTYDSFIDHVSHLECIEEDAKQDAMFILHQVRDRYEKPLQMPRGRRAKCLAPNVTIHATSSDESTTERDFSKKKRDAVLLCMPYFCLAPYSSSSSPQASDFYPLRTLLQYWHMSTPKKRDLQQAICGLEYSTEGHIFHIPQIWCLILGNKLLVTCMHSPATDDKRGFTGIKLKPTSTEDSRPLLRIVDGSGRLWLLPVQSCNTWLEFTANLRELSVDLEKEYDVLFAGVPQDAGCWPSLIERAKRVTVELRLNFKAGFILLERSSSPSDSTMSDESGDSRKAYGSSPTMETPIKSANLAAPDSGVSSSQESGARQTTEAQPNLSTYHSDLAGATVDVLFPKHTSVDLASNNSVNIFSWFAAVPSPSSMSQRQPRHKSDIKRTNDVSEDIEAGRSFLVDRNKVEDTLTNMHSFLCTSRFKKHREYRKCPVSTPEEVEATLATLIRGKPNPESEPTENSHRNRQAKRSKRDDSDSEKERIRASDGKGRSPPIMASDSEVMAGRFMRQHHAQMSKRVMKTSKALFQFFLPLHYKSEMVLKYWGAINLLIQDHGLVLKCLQSLDSRRGFPPDTPTRAKDVWHCKNIVNGLSPARAPPPYEIKFPEGLIMAWPHLLMFFILTVSNQHRRAFGELVRFREIAYRSRIDILESIARESLHCREAVLPLGITSLVVKNLLKDITLGAPDIESTYSESLEILRQELSSNPYSRVHQEKILRFRQEVACASDVLNDQLNCVRELLVYIDKSVSEIPHMFQRRREHYILLDCISTIRARTQSFREMSEDAAQLASWNIGRIESNKDRHEAAILVFTTVTVIFLPLSFVASVFGMNTADIRNMGHHQWTFWVSAIPVTIIVIGVSLSVIRYFDPARQALGQIFYRRGAEELELLEHSRQRPVAQSYESQLPPPPPPNPHMSRPNVIIRNDRPDVGQHYQDYGREIRMNSPRHRSHYTAPRERSRSHARYL